MAVCMALLASHDPVARLAADSWLVLRADPEVVSLIAVSGRTVEAMRVVITDSSGGPLPGLDASVDYRDGQVGGWLHTALEGVDGDTVELMLTPDSFGMPAGLYQAAVVVRERAGPVSALRIPVTFTVTAPWCHAAPVSDDPRENESRSSSASPASTRSSEPKPRISRSVATSARPSCDSV
jgi:hypothetical protein